MPWTCTLLPWSQKYFFVVFFLILFCNKIFNLAAINFSIRISLSSNYHKIYITVPISKILFCSARFIQGWWKCIRCIIQFYIRRYFAEIAKQLCFLFQCKSAKIQVAKSGKYASCLDFQKLEREARICRKLQHPNIVRYTRSSYLSLSFFLNAFFFLSLFDYKHRRFVLKSMKLHANLDCRIWNYFFTFQWALLCIYFLVICFLNLSSWCNCKL